MCNWNKKCKLLKFWSYNKDAKYIVVENKCHILRWINGLLYESWRIKTENKKFWSNYDKFSSTSSQKCPPMSFNLFKIVSLFVCAKNKSNILENYRFLFTTNRKCRLKSEKMVLFSFLILFMTRLWVTIMTVIEVKLNYFNVNFFGIICKNISKSMIQKCRLCSEKLIRKRFNWNRNSKRIF